jgi:hypothetical protein
MFYLDNRYECLLSFICMWCSSLHPEKITIYMLTVTSNNITIITNKCSYIHYVYWIDLVGYNILCKPQGEVRWNSLR